MTEITLTRNRRLRNARLLAHDLVCMSGCDGTRREDHARTAHQLARKLIEADDPTLRRLMHDLIHVAGCTGPAAHSAAITDAQVARWRSVLDLPTEPTQTAVTAILGGTP